MPVKATKKPKIKKKKDSLAPKEAKETDKKKKTKKHVGGKSKKGKNKGRCNIDFMTPAAMDNAYYVCHNVQDLLLTRGFTWPETQKKKKKGRR